MISKAQHWKRSCDHIIGKLKTFQCWRERFLQYRSQFGNTSHPRRKFESYLVAKLCPAESLTWTMWNDPGCFSSVVIVPTRPMLCPPVIIHKLPVIEHHTTSLILLGQATTTFYFVIITMIISMNQVLFALCQHVDLMYT